MVKIVRTDIKGNYKCDTNKKGHYFYNGLPLGTYNITVEIGGKEMDGVNGVRTSLGDPTPVNFDLQKIAQKKAAQNAPDVSSRGRHRPRSFQRAGTRHDQRAEGSLRQGHQRARSSPMKKNKELNDAFSAGLTAMQNKDYDTAVTSLTKASELDPKQVAVWAQLADAHVNAAAKKTGADFDADNGQGHRGLQ